MNKMFNGWKMININILWPIPHVRFVTNIQTLTLHSPAHRWDHLHSSSSFKIQLNIILYMRYSLLH